MKCPKCKTGNADKIKFCQHCGQPLQVGSGGSRISCAGNILFISYNNFQQISGFTQTPIDSSTFCNFPISYSLQLSGISKDNSLEI